MPIGIRPKVNEAREFLEIAKDFRDPKEIIREAISNSWDANATEISFEFKLSALAGTRAKRIDVKITDNGDGMDGTRISDFFDLGESHKPVGSIGTKGHGTKIYYKSQGISVDTWHNGERIHAETEVAPWPTLNSGKVPTYRWDTVGNDGGKGTGITILGFEAKQSDFNNLQELLKYILWYTVGGSFAHYFSSTRSIKIRFKSIELASPVTIDFGFRFPTENTDLTVGTSHICKILPPETVSCGTTSNGTVQLNVVGAILGDSLRSIVPNTYTHMGLWLCKDFIKVERFNDIIEEVTGGQYFYRQFLVLANSQQLDLTANREAFHKGDEEFDLIYESLKKYFQGIWNEQFTKDYFRRNKEENELAELKSKVEQQNEKEAQRKQSLADRVKAYDAKVALNVSGIVNPPVKEPSNEAETILLLQAMVSSRHASIDFLIGEYSAYLGQDFIIEYEDKGIRQKGWAEVVYTLERLFQWDHQLSSIHKIICWRRGDVSSDVKLTKKKQGVYSLQTGPETIPVYVLSEILST